jgi:hypothetical protein
MNYNERNYTTKCKKSCGNATITSSKYYNEQHENNDRKNTTYATDDDGGDDEIAWKFTHQ